MKYNFLTLTACLFFLFGCNAQKFQERDIFSLKEKRLLDSIHFDRKLISTFKDLTKSEFELFHYSLGKNIINGEELESDPIFLKGVVFKETQTKSKEIVDLYSTNFLSAGYTIFILESNFGYHPDYVAILHTTDKYEILKQVKTDAINYGIDNDSLIKIIKGFDNKYSLVLTGASGDWCNFIIKNPPKDWDDFAKEVYKVCPDVVDQGTGNLEGLANEMKRTNELYFWWD